MKEIGPFRCTLEQARRASAEAKPIRDREFLTDEFAKLAYLGGGWWRICGYHYAGTDAEKAYSRIGLK